MSLRDGTAKMSKSDPSDMSRINLTDDADTMMQKVRKAKTDPEALPSDEAGLEDAPRRAISSASMPRSPTRASTRSCATMRGRDPAHSSPRSANC